MTCKVKAAPEIRITPELGELGERIKKELWSARNIHASIGPKVNAFRDLMRDTKMKMEAKRAEHVARVGQLYRVARRLIHDQNLGPAKICELTAGNDQGGVAFTNPSTTSGDL